MNALGGKGLWDDRDGFYYDQLYLNGNAIPLRVRSMVGTIPLFAVEILEGGVIDKMPGFRKRMDWFLKNRADLARHISYMKRSDSDHTHYLLAMPSQERLVRVLKYLLDFAPCRGSIWIIPTFSTRTARTIESTIAPAKGIPACSAGTATGEGRSGFRSISFSWNRWRSIIISMATDSGSNAPWDRGKC
jgi:hypothetical protein